MDPHIVRRIDPRGPASFALIVDMVRITSAKVPERALGDSEGECVVETEGDGRPFKSIACDARSRGANARYRVTFDRISNFERKSYRR